MDDVCIGCIFKRYFKYHLLNYTGRILGDSVGVGSKRNARDRSDYCEDQSYVLCMYGIS